MSKENILVIKHGALGDMMLATAGFAAIRAAHPAAHITLLTTRPYAGLMAQSPYFDEIWVDSKPGVFNREGLKKLKAMLNSKRWAWVYDLQTSQRTTFYQWLLQRPWPNISNASRWVSHPRGRYDKSAHALENLRAQLQKTGMTVGQPELGWMQADISGFTLPHHCALLVPGGAPHRPQKRWPAEQYAALAQELVGKGITPLLIGTAAEQEVLENIAKRVPHVLNLGGRTSIPQLAELARYAQLAVGNDTGPMHVIAAAGCPSTVLFSADSDPTRCAPVGQVQVLREADLRNLSVDQVLVRLTGQV